MFKAFGSFFSSINEVFTAVNVLARTGTKVALQFEAEQDNILAQKKLKLAAQEELAEVITIEARA